MTKPPSKRGSGRGGKTPRKSVGAKPPSPGHGRKPHASPHLPSWLPDAGLARAMGPGRAAAGAGGGMPDPQAAREAARYEQPIASREMILQVLAAHDGPMDAEALASKLALATPDRLDALGKRLGAMLRDGQLLQNRRGGFVPAERADLIAGTIIANPDGFGFLRPDKGGGDDLFLPPFEMRKAMHGDRVLASVTGVDRRGRREGAIVEVLERRLNRLLGRYTLEAGIS
jgi:ribonuclease R